MELRKCLNGIVIGKETAIGQIKIISNLDVSM